jgi:hypothetical protein
VSGGVVASIVTEISIVKCEFFFSFLFCIFLCFRFQSFSIFFFRLVSVFITFSFQFSFSLTKITLEIFGEDSCIARRKAAVKASAAVSDNATNLIVRSEPCCAAE